MNITTLIGLAFAAVGLAMLIYVAVSERNNARRTRCRCCGDPIRAGGHGCAQLGMGFCRSCRDTLVKETK